MILLIPLKHPRLDHVVSVVNIQVTLAYGQLPQTKQTQNQTKPKLQKKKPNKKTKRSKKPKKNQKKTNKTPPPKKAPLKHTLKNENMRENE